MYGLPFLIKSFFIFSCTAQHTGDTSLEQDRVEKVIDSLMVGADQIDLFLPWVEGKRVGLVGNQSSLVGKQHVLDTLLAYGVDVVKIFSPEHGFRGKADAGEKIDSSVDQKTGVPIVSLYGNNKKPRVDQLQDIDILLFDLQDVGARFYTYISTLHYVMEACAENNKTLIVLDRPNPNGHIVDGPILKKDFKSFVGMHPIPILHGMTMAEYARMINGEGWLKDEFQCELKWVPCRNYSRYDAYYLPVPPSPNLRTFSAINLYPSLCLFEGTVISEGRGTDGPFERFGHPQLPLDSFPFQFEPKSGFGAKYPKLEGQLCNGLNLKEEGNNRLNQLELKWLISAYKAFQGTPFFIKKNNWFDTLAGTDQLRKAIEEGKSESDIRSDWKEGLDQFRSMRKEYLIYPE
jgi:uncharacterized protein YbbC (DUF1343 family)